jgi:tetratricopeptide (TPR) repeat protein
VSAQVQIGGYHIVDVLGHGGMGVVYRATHASGADLAVKTVRIATESTLASIRREIQTLRELRHPGVVAIRDHGIADGIPWYAMDLLHGRTLRDDLRSWFPDAAASETLTVDMLPVSHSALGRHMLAGVAGHRAPTYSVGYVATLFRKICVPLAYVHGRGVIHRDLSPGNIFLVGPVGEDQPVLFDFGLAAQFRVDSARDMLEVSGVLRGTAHYMAPEQARGEIVDARADIYALGCMLYEALAGRPPFIGESPAAVVMQHLEIEPEPPSVHAPGLPQGFDELVLRMLAKPPRDRIGYADDVATALERLGAPPRQAFDVALAPRAYTYRPGLAGRSELITHHDDILRRLADGIGGCGALLGESGVGKTRLASEIATRALATGLRVITGECEPISTAPDDRRGAPLHPLRPLLRLIADRCRDEGPEAAARLLGRSGGYLAAYEPQLAELAPPLTDHVKPDAARFLVLAALRDLLAEHARTGPVLVVLDDLQWADELTVAFLRSVGHGFLESAGVYVLVTIRAEEATDELDAMLEAIGASRFDVPRLDQAAVGAMVRDMLALEDDAPALTAVVAARSEGNPLFAAEYVRTAVDEGVLHRDTGGRWRLVLRESGRVDLSTPGSVHELVHHRLRSLSGAAREVTLAAAVLGRSFRADVLAAVSRVSDEVARTAIAEAIQRHVLEDQIDGGLRFVHDKLREQAWAELTETARRDLHRRAAEVIEHHFGGDLTLWFPQLAHHWEIAGELPRAGDYLERAAKHALGSAAYGEAHALLRRLIAFPIAVPSARRAGWEHWLGSVCLALGDIEGGAAHLERSLDRIGHSLPSSRPGWAVAVAAGVAHQLWSHARMPRPRTADPQVIEAALAQARMTWCHFFGGDVLAITGTALSAARLAETTGGIAPLAEIYGQIGYAAGLAHLGRVAGAYFARARAAGQSARDSIGLLRALQCEIGFHVCVGAWQAARTVAAEAMALAQQPHNPHEVEHVLAMLGSVELALGDYAASARLADSLYESARVRGNALHETWGLYGRGRAALYLGDLDAAIRDFERAIVRLAGYPTSVSHVMCNGMLASALARAGQPARSRLAADQAIRLIRSTRPTVFSVPEGVISAADAYLELARRGDRFALHRARIALDKLAPMARMFPTAAPAASTLTGLYLLQQRKPRRAARALRRALALATDLAMPYEQAVAHRGLAAAVGGDHERDANRLFGRLGCRWHIAHLQT